MTPIPANSWKELFAPQSAPDFTLKFRVIKKAGQPFLFLPLSSPLAAKSLALYPAQAGFPRRLKSILRRLLQLRVPLGLHTDSAILASRDPFPRFLSGLVHADTFPDLAILVGSPRADHCRFILLLFDESRRPAFVVKAGYSDDARRLIRREAAFLRSVPNGTPGIPALRNSFDGDNVSAFAADFVPGDSPQPGTWTELGGLLGSWLDRTKQIPLGDTAAWQTLEAKFAPRPVFQKLSSALAGLAFHPAIFHGDLAPWNVKRTPDGKDWIALDWERGDFPGIPGWDWFHYVIQPAILVSRRNATQLLENIEALFAHPSFQEYARNAGIEGRERLLLIAYLFHLVKIVQPSEGLQTNRELLEILVQRWLP